MIVFWAIAAWAVGDYRSRDLDTNLPLLGLAALVGTPLAVWLNGMELRVLARAGGQDPNMARVAGVSLIASCANVLPVPGSVLVRTWFLSRGAAGLAGAVTIQATAGATFVAVTIAASGVLLLGSSLTAALVLIVFGLVVLAVMVRIVGNNLVRELAQVEVLMAISEVGRYLVVFRALGVDSTLGNAAPLVLANSLSAAIGIFPAGLGIREVLSGLLAGLTDLDAALAVTVSAADRMATTLVLGLMLLVVTATGSRKRLMDDLRQPEDDNQ